MGGREDRIRVLVADDDPDICQSLQKYLERRGYAVSVAFDGAQAQRLIENERFSFFFLDCSMPELTGLELVAAARRGNPGARIVLVSGFPSVNDELLREMGGDLFLHKPVQFSDIDKILKEPSA
ncbi:MAG: response regulator [Deltaproteobacteria bacterium]